MLFFCTTLTRCRFQTEKAEHRWGSNIYLALVVSLVLSKELQLFQILFPLTSFISSRKIFLSGRWWRWWCGCHVKTCNMWGFFCSYSRQSKTQAKNCYKTWSFEKKAKTDANIVPVNTNNSSSLSSLSPTYKHTHTYTFLPQLQHTHTFPNPGLSLL